VGAGSGKGLPRWKSKECGSEGAECPANHTKKYTAVEMSYAALSFSEGCPILSSRFHRKKGSYESLDSSNGESLLTIRHVELSIGKVHLIRGT